MALARLDRILANLGYATRAEARSLVLGGRVSVAGRVVRDPGAKAEAAEVTLDGLALEAPNGLFVACHKPVGFVCSHDDRDGSRVWELLPPRWLARNPRTTTVGRLDKDSSGLLLVTDLHPLVHQLTAPRRHVPKRYSVVLDRPVEDEPALVARFASGALALRGEETPCLPAELVVREGGECEVVLTEGRHRQVRRMFGACGYQVVSLHRTAVGPYTLGDLPPGEWRYEDPTRVA
ncbi:MAG TPA: pseudouridine synthase [Acidimicrobiales bacterium]|jgi:16S rRNA pseudouridine516 synthase|nr:pseudouridine synthase [Acidimicrobiales bacterium]